MSENIYQVDRNLRVLARERRTGITRKESEAVASSEMQAHVDAPDPHPQYLLPLAHAQVSLGADFSPTGSGWETGLTMALGAGTWLVMASAHVTCAVAADVAVRLFQGGSLASAAARLGEAAQLSVQAVLALGSPANVTLDIMASDPSVVLARDAGGEAVGTRIVAVRISR